jgi:hypothetical protein
MTRRNLPRLTAGLAGLFAAVLVIVGAAVPAQAGYASGQCSVGNYFGRGNTWYTYTGGYDYVDVFEYTQQYGGSATDVRITHHGSSSGKVYDWSDASIAHFNWESHDPPVTVRTAGSESTRTVFKFFFDQFGPDPSCAATAGSW